MKDKNLHLFGTRIREVRKSLGLSQKEMAVSMAISSSSLSEFESGITKPTFYFFFNISKVHDVNLRYLFHGDGKMFHKDPQSNGCAPQPIDDDIQEMIYYLQIPALRLSLMAEYNRVKKIFKPLIDEFDNITGKTKEKFG